MGGMGRETSGNSCATKQLLMSSASNTRRGNRPVDRKSKLEPAINLIPLPPSPVALFIISSAAIAYLQLSARAIPSLFLSFLPSFSSSPSFFLRHGFFFLRHVITLRVTIPRALHARATRSRLLPSPPAKKRISARLFTPGDKSLHPSFAAPLSSRHPGGNPSSRRPVIWNSFRSATFRVASTFRGG